MQKDSSLPDYQPSEPVHYRTKVQVCNSSYPRTSVAQLRVHALLRSGRERCVESFIRRRCGRVEPSTLGKAHTRSFTVIAEQAKENKQGPVAPFVLYSLRHTFLTRLGESGCDAWTLARIAGHSSIAMSARWVRAMFFSPGTPCKSRNSDRNV
jgi:integrase